MGILKRILASFIVLVSTFITPLVFAPPAFAQNQTQARNFHVFAGKGGFSNEVAVMKFYPQSITINEGDSITWTAEGDAHTVTFLSGASAPAPLDPAAITPAGGNTYSGTEFLNSGLLTPSNLEEGVHSYTVTFTKAGTYTYNCLLHPGMSGTVVVQPAGSAISTSQRQIDFQFRTAGLQDISTGLSLLSGVNRFDRTANSDGTSNFNIAAGIGNGTESIMRFEPSWIIIQEGDTLTWHNGDPMQPHTVTFPGPNDQVFELPDPRALEVQGGTTVDGSALTSSGLLPPKGSPGEKSYTLKFPKAGTYNYECLFHDEFGMKGRVIVLRKL